MTQDLIEACHTDRAKASKTVKIGSRKVRRFMDPESAVDDGTLRCIFCGQIDEEPWHEPDLCFALRAHREGEVR